MKETAIGITVMILAVWAYTHLPMTWRRHKDIQFGNHLITQVQQYQQQHRRLPENHETTVLQQLGFRQNKQGWQPNYRKINATQFKIVYEDGYLPPFLTWDSQQQEWVLQ